MNRGRPKRSAPEVQLTWAWVSNRDYPNRLTPELLPALLPQQLRPQLEPLQPQELELELEPELALVPVPELVPVLALAEQGHALLLPRTPRQKEQAQPVEQSQRMLAKREPALAVEKRILAMPPDLAERNQKSL